MKKGSLLTICFTIISLLSITVIGCQPVTAAPTPTPTQPAATSTPTATPTPTPTPTPPAVVTDKKYNALSPRGVQLPVTITPLAKRPASIDGLTIYIVQGEADPVIMPALNDYLQKNNTKTTWVYYNPSSSFGPSSPDSTTLQNAKSVIRGNSW